MSSLSKLALFISLVLISQSPAEEPAENERLPAGAVARIGSPRFRHAGPLGVVQFSRDGRTILTVDRTGALLWDAGSGTLKRRIAAAPERFDDAALSDDGKTLFALDVEQAFFKFDVATGKLNSRVEAPAGAEPLRVAVEPRGNGFAIARRDETVRFYDQNAVQVSTAQTTVLARSLIFSPDGKTLAVCGKSDGIDLIDVATGERRNIRLEKIKEPRYVFAPNGVDYAIYGDGPWHRISLRRLPALERTGLAGQTELRAFAFSPDGKRFACVGTDDRVTVYDATTAKEDRRVQVPFDVDQIVFSPDGATLLTVSKGDNILLWDVKTGRRLPQSADPAAAVSGVKFIDDRRLLAGFDKTHVFDWRGGRVIDTMPEVPGRTTIASTWPVGNLLAAKADNDLIELVDLSTGKLRHRLAGSESYRFGFEFSPDGKRLFAADEDGSLRAWDTANGRLVVQLKVDRRVDWPRIVVSADGRYAAVASTVGLVGGNAGAFLLATTNPIRVWDVARQELVRSWSVVKGAIWVLCFSPDGHFLAAENLADSGVKIRELASGRLYRDLGPDSAVVSHMEYSPDGRTLATLGVDGILCVWELISGGERLRAQLSRQPGGLSFSPNGHYLATADAVSPVLVWDLRMAKSPATPIEARNLWTELAGADAKTSDVARRRLLAAPEIALAVIREHFRMPGPLDVKHARGLFTELDNAQFEVRQKALKELEGLDERSDALVDAALAETKSTEVRRQLARLVERRQLPVPRPGSVTAARVIELLEQLGTPAAREMLERFADGPETSFTRDAKASLRRLKGKP